VIPDDTYVKATIKSFELVDKNGPNFTMKLYGKQRSDAFRNRRSEPENQGV